MEAPDKLQGMANTLIVACHPRAVTNLFLWRGFEATQVDNLRSATIQEATQPGNSANEGWFPVIDKQRCVDCGRCFDFCLFGVYSKVDNHIVVTNPGKCKNNCPACARMCPERAIIFPKYDKSPINGGLEEEETFSAESMEAIYNERLRYKLQERRQSVSLLKKP
jgi:ferredoxin